MRLSFFAILAGWLAAAPATVRAHHGQEFLVAQDASVPSLWSGTLFGNIEWSKDGSQDGWETESGFLVGVAPRIAAGAAVGFADGSGRWDYESVAPFVQIQLTPPQWHVRVAVIAGYHFADGSAGVSPSSVLEITDAAAPRAATTTTTRTVTTTPEPEPETPVQCGPDYGPDAPPCALDNDRPSPRHVGHTPATSTTVVQTKTTTGKNGTTEVKRQKPTPAPAYDGIHRHDEDHFFSRLVIEADLTSSDKFIFNLIALCPENGKPAWGYAAGLRHAFNHDWAIGAEAIGDFGDANEHELVLGGYFSPIHTTAIKLGAGLGLTEASPDFSLRAGVILRF